MNDLIKHSKTLSLASLAALVLISGTSMQPAKSEDANHRRANIHRTLLAVYQAEGKTAQVNAEFLQVIKMDPSDATAHYDYGAALLKQSKAAAAIAQFNQACKLAPDRSDYWAMLANTQMGQNNYPGALTSMQRATMGNGGSRYIPQYQSIKAYIQNKQQYQQYQQNLKQRQKDSDSNDE